MKILFVASEVSPVIEVGGLADVVASLSKELIRLGHDVRIIIPKYSIINSRDIKLSPAMEESIPAVKHSNRHINLLQSTIKENVKIYFVENDSYFGDGEVYGKNELEKFYFFSRAVVELLPELNWQPDIIHCHDWHTSLISMFIKKWSMPYKTVLTIHNLAYQGWFDKGFLYNHNLAGYWNAHPFGISGIPYNFLGQGILYSDLINTVSISFAREILMQGNGEGLDEILNYRRDSITGIVNGIDYEVYNPETDKHLIRNYSYKDVEKRYENKLPLKRKLGLEGSSEIPLICFIQRLYEQKGIDILAESMENILKDEDVQIIILGKGKQEYEIFLMNLAGKYPKKLVVNIGFDNALAHLMYAGCDINLIPSLFEPCGLVQMIAMRYGTLPVVRHTGGLIDTVSPFKGDLTRGSGFVFYQYSGQNLANIIRLAIEKMKNRSAWLNAVKRVMQLDFSWREPALKYEQIYRRLINN
jgi:starch synthase